MGTLLDFCSAGESHGCQLTAIINGLPAGVPLDVERIDRQLACRQRGYGRGPRMQVESDCILITSGMRHGRTLGTPLALTIPNRDWPNWQQEMSPTPPPAGFVSARAVTVPRPGHADLAGAAKFGHLDMRNVLERASARETAVRVAVGAICQQLLAQFEVKVRSWVISIGGIKASLSSSPDEEFFTTVEGSDLRCGDPQAAEEMRGAIDEARQRGDSLGGEFEVHATGVPPGLGSMASWQERLDARLAGAVMSIPAIKSVEIGMGKQVAEQPGSQVHDPIRLASAPSRWPFKRDTNNAGGIEGGMSNGEPIIVRAAMKPIPTLTRPLPSVSLLDREPSPAHVERSDICAVPAASLVGEAMVAFVLAQAFREKFGGDNLRDMQAAYEAYWGRLCVIGQPVSEEE